MRKSSSNKPQGLNLHKFLFNFHLFGNARRINNLLRHGIRCWSLEKKLTRRQVNLNSWGEDALGSSIEEYSEVERSLIVSKILMWH